MWPVRKTNRSISPVEFGRRHIHHCRKVEVQDHLVIRRDTPENALIRNDNVGRQEVSSSNNIETIAVKSDSLPCAELSHDVRTSEIRECPRHNICRGDSLKLQFVGFGF